MLYEAAKAAGGRCRSYLDATLDLTIDNGNHLLLSGNRSALSYVALIGGGSALSEAAEPAFDFVDLGTGEGWRVRPNLGRVPWWIFLGDRRVPGTRALDYAGPMRLFLPGPDRPVGEVLRCAGPLYEKLWRPVLVSALNTEVPDASAHLTAAILRETLGAGGEACRPVIASGGLSPAFVEPALAFIRARGGEIRLGERLRALGNSNGSLESLSFSGGEVRLAPGDAVVLAVPPWVAADLLPGLTLPNEHRGILNAHFRATPPAGLPAFLGMIGGISEWLFAYPDRLSVTISAADRLFDTDRDVLAATIWSEIAAATGLRDAMPAWQIVKEKRATFAATPRQNALRPECRTAYPNLVLAGDWTRTGLPATIEGAIRSGEIAASVLHRRDICVSRSVSKA